MLKKGLLLLLALMVITFGLDTPSVQASSLPYSSYTYDADNWPIWMPAPYKPVEIIGQSLYMKNADGGNDVVKGLSTPEDLFIDDKDDIYVADKGNNRIVKFNSECVIEQQFGIGADGKSQLKSPEGVYVDTNGYVYVADTGNQRIVIFDQSNSIIGTIGKPDDLRIKDIMFTPIKLTVDARGYIFVAIKGGNEGLLILSPDGVFHGFFGRNATEINLSEKIKRIFYTDEQIATNENSRAMTISGVVTGKDGYIYTCTQNIKSGQIKKFNASGTDLFLNRNFQVIIPSRLANGEAKSSSIAAITVDKNDIIYAGDTNNGAVIIYGSQGQILSIFGSRLGSNEMRVGVFGMINGIAVDSKGDLYVLDKQYNGIHVFQPTQLMKEIINAIVMYNDGRYSDAIPLWQDILNMNSNYYLANLGLGRAAYDAKAWTDSMHQMKVALDQEGYSKAFWQYRSDWIQKNITTYLLSLIILIIVYKILAKLLKLSPISWLQHKTGGLLGKLVSPVFRRFPIVKVRCKEVAYAFNIIKHPVDTFYNSARRGRGSVWSAFIIFIIYTIVQFVSIGVTSFSFNKYGLINFDPMDAIIRYILPIFLWTFCVYLVGAITKGQGTLKAIFITSMYSLIPQTVLTLPIAIISNVLTWNEKSIYTFMLYAATAWTGVLLFLQVKEVHGYEFGETIKRIIMTLFTAGVATVLGAAIFGISMQAFNLASELIREVLGFV